MNNKSASSLSLRKLLLSALVVAPLATLPTPLWAVLPSTASTNLTSTAGSSTTFSTSGTTLTITTPDRTVLNWGAFSVDSGDTVGFALPATSSSVLNRVTGGAQTTIAGNLTSNGSILVLNDAGIVVSGTGNITAAGITLSTIPETEYNYLATGSLAGTGTPAVAGDISATGVLRVGQSGTVSLVANDVVVGGTVDAGTLSITTKANVTPTAGTVALNGGLIVGNTASSYGNVTIASNGGQVDLGATAGNILISGGNLTVNTGNATTGGAIIETNAGLTIGNGTSAGNLTLDTRSSTTTAGTATVTGVAANGGAQLNVTLNTGTATITDTNGDIQLNAGTANNLSVTATNGNIKSGGNVTSPTVTLLSAATAGKSITYSAAGNTTFTTITSNATGNVTVTGTGTISVPAINPANIVTLGGTNLTQTGAIVANTAIIQASGNATMSQTNDVGTVIFKNGTGTQTWTDGNAVTIGNGTSTSGNISVTGTAITLGSTASDTISVGGSLTLSGSSIADLTDNTVSGVLNITSTGAVTLDGSVGTGLGLNNSYGVVNVSAAGQTVTLLEKTTLTLGNITATDLRAYSQSDIANTGKLVIAGTLTAGAGTASAPGAVAINYSNATVGSGNQIANIRVLDDNTLLGLTGLGIGNYLASSLTVTNESGFGGITIPANIYGTGLPGSVTLTDVNNVGINNGAGVLVLSGTLTLNEKADGTGTGTINLNNAGNKFSAVTVNSTGPVTVSATGAYTANATLKSSASAVSFTSTDAITIGSYSSLATGVTTFTTVAGKAITDSVTGISIFGPVSFTGGSVSITRAGHNFGGVTVATLSNGNATIVEAGTLNLAGVGTGTGTFSGTSSSGNIIDSGTLVVGGNATFSASSGTIVLDTAANNFGNVSLTASGNSTIVDTNAVALSDVTVSSGTFTVNTTGAITQVTGKSINVYGASTFTSGGANAITLGNSGNRFGALTLTTTNGAVTVKEQTTVNLGSVNTGGAALTVTSEGGSIIDSGTILATGSASFTASTANGTIVLDSAANDLGTVTVSTTGSAGNVTLTDGVGNLVLGSSSVGGSLLVNQTSGNISQGGPLTVAGESTFNATAAASSLLLTDNQNQLGALKFVVGTGGAIISELTTMNLRAGTVANGQVTLNTGGNFVTSGTGGSTFLHNVVGQQSLIINATGTITPGTGSLVVRNGLTVNSSGAKDLSGLSLSGSLFGVAPTNQGTGAYTAPSP